MARPSEGRGPKKPERSSSPATLVRIVRDLIELAIRLEHKVDNLVHQVESLRHLRIRLGVAALIPKDGGPPVQVSPLAVPDTFNVSFVTHPVDAAGNPRTPTLTWTSSDPNVIALTPAADTLSALGATGQPGTAIVSAGVGQASDSIEITVNAEGVVSIGLSASPVPK